MGHGMHELAYEAVLRQIAGLEPTASIRYDFSLHVDLYWKTLTGNEIRSMRESAGVTLKSSISHTWTKDTRDDRIKATRGLYSKVLVFCIPARL
jgi:outer membrane protein insertion porin family